MLAKNNRFLNVSLSLWNTFFVKQLVVSNWIHRESLTAKGVNKQKFVVKKFLPSHQCFWSSKKSSNDMVSQRVLNHTFLCNIGVKSLWQRHHNERKHCLLLWHKKFILHKYHILFQIIHMINIYFNSLACFQKPKKIFGCILYPLSSTRIFQTTCFIIFVATLFKSDLPLAIYNFNCDSCFFVVLLFFLYNHANNIKYFDGDNKTTMSNP